MRHAGVLFYNLLNPIYPNSNKGLLQSANAHVIINLDMQGTDPTTCDKSGRSHTLKVVYVSDIIGADRKLMVWKCIDCNVIKVEEYIRT